MTTMHPLTDAQRQFAEENHHLVGRYLRLRRLDANEYYDVVIFRYLHAVQRYDEQPELRRHNFKTIAYDSMRSALYNHFRAQKRETRGATVYSFEEIQEAVTDASCAFQPHEYAEVREQWCEIQPITTPKQMQALRLRAEGYTGREIGKVLHIAPGSASGRICRLRKKVCAAA